MAEKGPGVLEWGGAENQKTTKTLQEANMETTERGFLLCPKCGGKTKTKVLPETVLLEFPLYCPKCKRETVVTYTACSKPNT